MATRTAAVRMTLEGNGFLSGLKQASTEVETFGKKISKALHADAGWKAVRGELKGMGEEIGRAGKLALGIGTSLIVGGGIKNAIDMQKKFQDLAFAMKANNGIAVDWQSMLKKMQGLALETGQKTDDLRQSFDLMREDVGADFATDAIRAVGIAATASGKPVEELGRIAGVLNEKFGIGGGEIESALGAVIGLGNQGGISIEEMSEKLGIMGASAKAAGISGVGGLKQIIGMANIGDSSIGSFKKNVSAVSGLIDKIGDKASRKAFIQNFGVDTQINGKQRPFTDILGDLFKATKGQREKLQLVFTGEQFKLVNDLAGQYAEVFNATTGTMKDKTREAADNFKGRLDDAGKSAIGWGDLVTEQQSRMQDPQIKIQQGMEALAIEFTKPEMIKAINELAAYIPKLAHGIAEVVQLVEKFPIAAASMALTMKLGSAFVMGAIKDAFNPAKLSSVADKAVQAVGGAGKGGGGGGAGGMVGGLAAAAGIGLAIGLPLYDYIKNEGSSGFDKNSKDLGDITKNLSGMKGKELENALPGAISQFNKISNDRSTLDKTMGFSDVEFKSARSYILQKQKEVQDAHGGNAANELPASVSKALGLGPGGANTGQGAAQGAKLDPNSVADGVARGMKKEVLQVRIVGGMPAPGGAPVPPGGHGPPASRPTQPGWSFPGTSF